MSVNIRWSVGIVAAGDRVMKREEIIELADAVATSGGIATGIGTRNYGIQIVVFARTREEAISKGKDRFEQAVETAGLPVYPIVRVEAISEDEDY